MFVPIIMSHKLLVRVLIPTCYNIDYFIIWALLFNIFKILTDSAYIYYITEYVIINLGLESSNSITIVAM